MTGVNWQMGIMPNIGGNALAAFERGQEQGRRRKAEEAFANYATNPDDPNALNALAQYDPKFVVERKQQMVTAQAQAQEKQRADLLTMGKLLSHAKDPATYAQARQAAQMYGMDISQVPEQYDPNWIGQTKMLVDAFNKDGGQSLTTLAQNVMMTLPPEQRDPNSPVFVDAFKKAFIAEQTKTIPYTQGGGVAGYNPYTGQTNTIIAPNPGDKPTGAPVGGGSGMPRVSTPQEAAKLPPGTKFVMPDGRIGTVPGGASGNAGGNFRPVSNAGSVAQSLFPGVRVTQVRRDPNSSLGRANPNSWHNKSGGAVDVAPIPGMTFDQYVQAYRNAGFNIIEARDEVNNPSRHATGPHWHIVLGERN